MSAINPETQGDFNIVKKVYLRYRFLFLLLLMIVIVASIVLTLIIGMQSKTKNWLFLGFPDNDEEVDLSLVRYGRDAEDGIVLTKNAAEAHVLLLTSQTNDKLLMANSDYDNVFSILTFLSSQATRIGNFGYDFGGFQPDSQYLLFWYREDDETGVYRIRPGEDTATLLFETESFIASGDTLNGSDLIFITETRNDKLRCYVSKTGNEAERFGKGQTCGIISDGSKLYVMETSNEDKTSLLLMDVAGENETKLLDDKPGVINYQFSFDGSKVAYVQMDNYQYRVYLMDTESGENIWESEKFVEITDFGFPKEGDTFFYIGEADTGELQLFVVGSNEESKIASGIAIHASLNKDGKHLIFLVEDEEGEYGLNTFDVSLSSKKEILSGDFILYDVVEDFERILIQTRDDDELVIRSASIDGQSLVELYKEDDASLEYGAFLPRENLLFLLTSKNNLTNLVLTRMDQEDGTLLLEDWDEINILALSPDRSQIVFTGQEEEGDDPALYSITLASTPIMEELENDAVGFNNAVFSPGQGAVLYTARTGDDSDEVEIRQVPVDGSERYEVLYEGAFLIDAQWSALAPFLYADWQKPLSGTSLCPGAPVLALGGAIKDKIDANTNNCYRMEISNSQLFTITVDGTIDTLMDIYDRTGNRIISDNDSGTGNNPLIRTTIAQPGIYFVRISASDPGEYNIQVMEGVGNPVFDNATPLISGSQTRGAITSLTQLDVSTDNYKDTTYGTMYYFDGKQGDQIQIDVFCSSIQSKLDSVILLFDPTLSRVYENDDGGSGRDSRIIYSLPRDGRYYILVRGIGDVYGSTNEYFYDILLTLK